MMPNTLQKAPATARTAYPRTLDSPDSLLQNSFPVESETVKVLLVSPLDDDHRFLMQILRHSKWKYYIARNRAEALTFLRDNAVPVLICEADLIDGTWRDLLDETTRIEHAPLLIVTSRLADDALWAEVLNLGGYNVLAQPFDSREVFRVVGNAWLHWKNRGKYSTLYARSA
jgi:DNA-binding response OmpR family regulator